MDIKSHINKIHYDLLTQFEEVTIQEKSNLKFGNYFEISNISEGKEVKMIITMKDIEYQQEDECKKTEGEITISYWKKCLPNYLKAIKYVYTISCGYEMIRNIYSNFRLGEELSIENIKTILLEFYSTFTDTNKILDILDLEGKKTLVQQFKSGNINWSEFIFSEGYFITNLDLWIIITKFKIPSFIISQKTLLETNHNENIITLYGEPHDSFIFIVTSAIRSVYRNHYQILYKEDTNNIRFEIDIIKNREYHLAIKHLLTCQVGFV
jgi:hypothetical protein